MTEETNVQENTEVLANTEVANTEVENKEVTAKVVKEPKAKKQAAAVEPVLETVVATEVAEEIAVPAVAEETAEIINQVDLDQGVILKKGDSVRGKIVKIEDDKAYVDVGYKYDGIIPLRELSALSIDHASDAVSIGQEVECKVSNINDAKETMTLSKRAIDSVHAWEQLKAKFESGEVFEAVVADVVKGGLVVDVGVRGFVPASMVERHFVDDFSDYKGRTLRFKVKEIDQDNNKVILSQKDVLDAEFQVKKQQLLSEIKIGQLMEGSIQRLTTFGAFVDLGGIDGLVHVSEISWSHVEKPSDVVKEGELVQVRVLKVDPANDRISLSIKQAQPGPWEQVENTFKTGEIVEGKVRRLAAFGAFVEIAPGVEGLVHISQISHKHIGTPHEVLKEGQTVQVKILEINPDDKRVSLSIKETEEAPAASEKPERQERQGRREPRDPNADAYTNESFNITLGERFGDKLSKFK
ncbi:MAG: 30S ribosomal protein S1 [Paenibacillaceae bacterium]